MKTHKDPYGWRFIAGGADQSLNVVGEWTHKALSALVPEVDVLAAAVSGGGSADDTAETKCHFTSKDVGKCRNGKMQNANPMRYPHSCTRFIHMGCTFTVPGSFLCYGVRCTAVVWGARLVLNSTVHASCVVHVCPLTSFCACSCAVVRLLP